MTFFNSSLRHSFFTVTLVVILTGCDQTPQGLTQVTERSSSHEKTALDVHEAAGESTKLLESARRANEVKNARAKVLATCVTYTHHELDSPVNDYRSLESIGENGVAACRRAIEEFPESIVAHEHLARALLAMRNRPPGLPNNEADEVTVRAARAGSLWAQSHSLIFGVEEFDRRTLVQRLHDVGAARPYEPGPKVLLAQTLMVVNGQILPYTALHRPAELLEAASRMSGGPAMVSAMASHLMSYGMCGRAVPPWSKVLKEPSPDFAGEEGCALILRIAANADDPVAHLTLGVLHLRNARQAGAGQNSKATALARFEESKRAAKSHFSKVAQSNSLLSDFAKNLLVKVDGVQMVGPQSEELGANILLGLLGLALSSQSAPEANNPRSSNERVLEEQAERRKQECADAKARAAFTSPDGSNEDWGLRHRATNCS
ncbi:hypothetical protein [Variovorax sp. PvP013]|uniref:hypothetical protein n=1 Tax=Variovorax sp. PvP013 TaxID=3156435 RepID=UPI003D1E5521